MPQLVQHQQVRPHRHPRSTSAQQSSLERHRRKCSICNHPDREEIEERFTHWRNLGSIVEDFNLDDIRVIYRHAHATGLYEQRRRNYLFTIENILECGEDIELTASAYIKAVRAYACLCDTVRWTEPATRVHHDYHIHTDSSGHNNRSRESSPGTDSVAVPSSSLPQAASNNPATAASRQAQRRPDDVHSVDESQATNHAPVKKQQAGASPFNSSVSSADTGEKCLAAAIPILVASPDTAAQSTKAGLSHLSELAVHDVSPASNRQIPELESPVTPTKQTPEAISNRHKFTK